MSLGRSAGDAVEAGREATIRDHRRGVGAAGAFAGSGDTPKGWALAGSRQVLNGILFWVRTGAPWLRRELVACLRTGRALRVPRARTRDRGKKFVTPEIMISERPAEADDRAVPGHWEGDLILGLGSSAIGTLVERTTRGCPEVRGI